MNAFNALEYGEQQRRTDLVTNAYKIFDSYLQNGFSETGFFNEAGHKIGRASCRERVSSTV